MRRPRVHFPGAVYHAMARGVDRRSIFIDDSDRRRFLSTINRVTAESGSSILAYCLMGNHFHIAIKIGVVPLSSVMQRLLTSYSSQFNLRHGRTGHLFDGRYKANLCVDDAYLACLIKYICLNPVRAGLVSRATDWEWSSAKEMKSAEFDEPAGFDPWNHDTKLATALLRDSQAETASVEHIATSVALSAGVSIERIRSGASERILVRARQKIAQEAVASGHSLTRIADWMGVSIKSVSRYSAAKVSKCQA